MATFVIETPNGSRLTIEAPDEATALRGAQEWYQQQSQPRVIDNVAQMGSDGVSGDQIRAAAAGDTRSQMRYEDIENAWRMAAGNRPEQQAMARAYVERERRDNPFLMGVDDRVRATARGVPFVGEFLDSLSAAGAGDEQARQMRMDYENARDQTFDQQSPVQSLAARAAGGIGGSIAALPMVAGNAGSLLFGVGAKTLPGAIGRGALAGGLQGAASGYGREGTLGGTLSDVAIGATLGAGIPAVMAGGKAAFDAIKSRVTPPDALSNVPAKARDFFVSQFGDPNDVRALMGKMDDIGPNAVLADVSPEMLMIARGSAARPGVRQDIVDALKLRDASKNARLRGAIDESLGPVSEPSVISEQIKQSKQNVGPLYDDALANATRVNTDDLALNLDSRIVNERGGARAALEDARAMLNIYGTKELDPSPQALFNTREALSGKAKSEMDKTVARALWSARAGVDDVLQESVPDIKRLDAYWQSLSKQDEALADGARLFETGKTAMRPYDLQQKIASAVDPDGKLVGPSVVPLRLRQGARADIDRAIGAEANDVAALRKYLKGEGDWNRDKLAMLFSDENAARALKAVDSETAMENTYRQVVGGSPTEPTRGYSNFLDKAAEGVNVPAEASATGLALRGARGLFGKLTGQNNQTKAEKFAKDLARLSISGGNDARDIIQSVLARQQTAAAKPQFFSQAARFGAGAATPDDPTGVKAAIFAAIMARDYARDRVSGRGSSQKTK